MAACGLAARGFRSHSRAGSMHRSDPAPLESGSARRRVVGGPPHGAAVDRVNTFWQLLHRAGDRRTGPWSHHRARPTTEGSWPAHPTSSATRRRPAERVAALLAALAEQRRRGEIWSPVFLPGGWRPFRTPSPRQRRPSPRPWPPCGGPTGCSSPGGGISSWKPLVTVAGCAGSPRAAASRSSTLWRSSRAARRLWRPACAQAASSASSPDVAAVVETQRDRLGGDLCAGRAPRCSASTRRLDHDGAWCPPTRPQQSDRYLATAGEPWKASAAAARARPGSPCWPPRSARTATSGRAPRHEPTGWPSRHRARRLVDPAAGAASGHRRPWPRPRHPSRSEPPRSTPSPSTAPISASSH